MSNSPNNKKKKYNLFERYKRLQKIRKRLPALHYCETHLVDHCNLDCMGCIHYSSISNESFVNKKKYKNDLTELSKKIRFKSFRLMGGEPLLHPEIVNLIETARTVFPRSRLAIVTNGILLSTMPESFWETCRKNNIIIDLSKYPPTKEMFPQFLDLIKKNNVKVGNIHPGHEMYFFHNQFGTSDVKTAFKYCGRKSYKINVLKNGKMYTCPKTAFIDIYNNYFNTNVPTDKGIDIYKYAGKVIINYLKKPVATCAYCLYGVVAHKWSTTSKSKDEWNAYDTQNFVEKAQNYLLKKPTNEK